MNFREFSNSVQNPYAIDPSLQLLDVARSTIVAQQLDVAPISARRKATQRCADRRSIVLLLDVALIAVAPKATHRCADRRSVAQLLDDRRCSCWTSRSCRDRSSLQLLDVAPIRRAEKLPSDAPIVDPSRSCWTIGAAADRAAAGRCADRRDADRRRAEKLPSDAPIVNPSRSC